MSNGKWKCKQKDKIQSHCTVCGKFILVHPLLEERRGHICPNCLRKKTNLERFGMEEPPKNVRKDDLLKFKSEMDFIKDKVNDETYLKIFTEKIEYLKANTPQALGLLKHSAPSKKKRPVRYAKWLAEQEALRQTEAGATLAPIGVDHPKRWFKKQQKGTPKDQRVHRDGLGIVRGPVVRKRSTTKDITPQGDDIVSSNQ